VYRERFVDSESTKTRRQGIKRLLFVDTCYFAASRASTFARITPILGHTFPLLDMRSPAKIPEGRRQ